MKKYALFLLCFFLGGCVFNPNNKDVLFTNGKAYYIPVETKQGVIDEKVYTEMQSAGVNLCNLGDLFWVSQYDVGELERTNDFNVLKKLFEQGLAGCAPAMSKEEIEYHIKVMELKNQQRAASYQATAGWEKAANSWVNGMYNSANYMNALTQQNTLNSINRQLGEINYNLQQRSSGSFYNIRPIYP